MSAREAGSARTQAAIQAAIQAKQAAFYGDDAIHCVEAGNRDYAYSQARRAARHAADSIALAEGERTEKK